MLLKKISISVILLFITSISFAQKINIHSHNDYLQNVPFWNAYANGLKSIEVDIFLKDDVLYATHSELDIKKEHTIESLYLKPIVQAMSLHLGTLNELQLLVDIKSEAHATLKKLINVLERYPTIIRNNKITIVISGNRPPVSEYFKYPDYIKFDYQSLESHGDKEVWNKIAMLSLSFKEFSDWNGKGRLTHTDFEKVKTVIDKAHAYGIPFRFWATPDSKTAWKTFVDMGVDYINTDMPYAASSYLKTLNQRVYQNTTTSEVYTPSYASDQKNTTVKNIILLIGDGNGLTQISSSTLANGGTLTLTQLKSIGLIKTQAADDFTTDSAAAGTALATGEKTNNRAIGVNSNGQAVPNIIEILSAQGFVSGCITTDNLTGATPSSFYAHRIDRADMKGIRSDLLQSKFSLLVGGGAAEFEDVKGTLGFSILDNVNAIGLSKEDKVCYFVSKQDVPSVLQGRKNLLAEATKNGLQFLQAKEKPFFLMVEAAQIDSYGHHNSVSGIVSEGIDFDRAITEAIKFADANENTLVIITADHETSGFSIPQGNLKDKMIEGDFTTHDHTGTMVPIFAYGPKSNVFQGVYENNEVFNKMLEVLGAVKK